MSSFPPKGDNIFSSSKSPLPMTQPTGITKKASLIPTLVAIALMLVSVFISVIVGSSGQNLSIYVLGYLATPLLVSLCMGWDSIDQRKKTKSDPWFIPKSKYSLFLRILTGLSFVIALPHINAIARILSTFLAEQFGS